MEDLSSHITGLENELNQQDSDRRTDLQNTIVRLDMFDEAYFLKVESEYQE